MGESLTRRVVQGEGRLPGPGDKAEESVHSIEAITFVIVNIF